MEEVYVSISSDKYRVSKASILKSQADLLESMKNLNNIITLSKQKNNLKKKLHQIISSLENEIDSLEKKLPAVEIPKELKKESQLVVGSIEDYSKKDKIDEELKLIQKKLKELDE